MDHAKVTKYESFLNDVLRADLQKEVEHREEICEKLAVYSQLSQTIDCISKVDGTDGLMTRVNIGSNFYVHAHVPDTSRIYVDVGLGLYVELTQSEAKKVAEQKVLQLNEELSKYSDLTFPSIETEDIPKELVSISELNNQVQQEARDLNDRKQKRPLCPTHPELLKGFQSPSTTELKATERENWATDLARDLRVKNGFWQPTHCEARYAVSVIVCVRDRAEQLRRFLLHMHTFLSRQMLRYRIVVVKQNNTLPFNRAKLFNIGFKEAVKASKAGPEGLCVVFHDVDLLPLNDFNTYACTKSPRHMSVAVDSLRFELPYRTLCGGALALTAQQFRSVDGFSNEYNGWGGEDDDFCDRLKEKSSLGEDGHLNLTAYPRK
ncbi:Prefoldin alpha-like [Trinorchestia longiramus]|nr:Prefoldin alpha-like [Trinorchestia longiramus]